MCGHLGPRNQSRGSTAAVLLNWNSSADTIECVRSIRDAGYRDLSIIVVDNHSSDNSVQTLRGRLPDIEIVENDCNVGFAAGCNIGMKIALRRGFEYVLLLNNDTVVRRSFLEAAVGAAIKNPRAGLIGGKTYLFGDKARLWDAGGEIDWLRGRGRRVGHGEIDRGQFEECRKVGFVTGCLMLIKREVLEQVGLIPEEYFFGVEEWDYGVRVRQAGYDLIYVPDFQCWHKVGGTHESLDPKWVYCNLRSRLLFMKRNAPKTWYPFWLSAMWTYGFYKRYIQLPRLRPDRASDLRRAVTLAFKDHNRKSNVTTKDLNQFA